MRGGEREERRRRRKGDLLKEFALSFLVESGFLGSEDRLLLPKELQLDALLLQLLPLNQCQTARRERRRRRGKRRRRRRRR